MRWRRFASRAVWPGGKQVSKVAACLAALAGAEALAAADSEEDSVAQVAVLAAAVAAATFAASIRLSPTARSTGREAIPRSMQSPSRCRGTPKNRLHPGPKTTIL